MIAKFLISLVFMLLWIFPVKSQISWQLQDAISRVPIVNFAYPANRDRNHLPPAEGPRAYLYAFIHLPYAINLGMEKDDVTNGYVSKVIVDFQSVRLSSGEEKKILKNAVTDLQNILDQQGYQTHIAGFNARTHFNRSIVSRFSSRGDVIMAVREMMCTQDLINKLCTRWNNLH